MNKKVKPPGASNIFHPGAFKSQTYHLMKRIAHITLLFISLLTFAACDGYNPYSSYHANIVFDGTIYPYNQARSFGQFICIRKGANIGEYKVTDAMGKTQTVSIPQIHLQEGKFYYGLGGLIIGTPSTYGDGTMTAYDWACPKCDKARHRVEIDYKSAFKYATCPNCGVKFDLNSGGIPVEGESRPLWRYRIFDNGFEVIVQN